jgi:hypothetical protein
MSEVYLWAFMYSSFISALLWRLLWVVSFSTVWDGKPYWQVSNSRHDPVRIQVLTKEMGAVPQRGFQRTRRHLLFLLHARDQL